MMLAIAQPDLLIRKLIEKLNDADPRTRRNAAGALRLHGARAVGAIPALAGLLEDKDSKVRYEAERALDQLRAIAV
jgi:HEAT repeat protein